MKVWLFADYSQAENRIVAWAGPVPLMKEWFIKGEDIHLNTAKIIGRTVQENNIQMPHKLFTKPYSSLTKEDKKERYIGKQTNHANNYGLGEITFAARTGLPRKFAGIVQDIYFKNFPEVRTGYQAWIISQLNKTRTLINPLGWKRTFYDIYGPELERAAFAWYPQSTIGLMLIRALRRLCEIIKVPIKNMLWTPRNIGSLGLDIQLQVHDSIGVVTEEDKVEQTALIIKDIMESPIMIRDEPLVIPVDFKYGPSWGDLHDLKL